MKKKEALRIIEKLGFEIRTRKERFALYRHKGRLILTTAVPKGRGDLYIEHEFRQQLKLTAVQLREALRCPFGSADYVQHLKDLGHIEEDDGDDQAASRPAH